MTRGDAAAWDERYAAGSPWPQGPNPVVREVATPLPPGRARDVACGDGRHAIWLAGLGWTVDAVDFSEVAIERGRQVVADLGEGALPGSVRWSVADVTTDRPEPRASDLVVLAYLHLPPDRARAALLLSADAVAPGGTLLLVAHDRRNLDEGVGGPQHPEVLADADEVAALLTEAGLHVERAGIVRRPVADTERTAVDAVVVATRPAAPH